MKNTRQLERINSVVGKWSDNVDAFPGAMYSGIYPGDVPETYSLQFSYDGILKHYKYELKPDFKRTNRTIDFDLSNTLLKFKEFDNIVCYPISMYEYYVIGDELYCPFILSLVVDGKHSHEAMIDVMTSNIVDFMTTYGECFCKKSNEDNSAEFGIATLDPSGGLYTSWYTLSKTFKCDIEKNYNDDLPYDKICSIIENEDKADLMLFYGEPGTGKSSLIKHLINVYSDTQFIFLDACILQSVQPASFITYLTENENSVLILEDCEKIIESRESSNGAVMSTILNITDGVISDILGIKLICTFNTSLNKVDKALLRKGRLSLKYEFKKLTKEKAQKINPNIVEDTAIADLYNSDENDFSKVVTKKIGF